MNSAILNTDIQDFIHINLNKDITKISLGKSPFPEVSSKELAEQIDSKKRCQFKLPLWFNTSKVYYPEKLAIEQCSSQLTALYKAEIVTGESLIDLTGGFGVDVYFFSTKITQVTHCEINSELSEISNYNSKVLGAKIKYVNDSGIEHLKNSSESFDIIYVDPSRRVSSRKVFLLKDCEPDIISNLEYLKSRAAKILIKTAPLLDLNSTIQELGTVNEIHILSIKNECKEVLYLLDTQNEETDPIIVCSVLSDHGTQIFRYKLSEEKQFELSEYSEPLEYLYEPDAALLKAGCFKLITERFDVEKISRHTHLYTSATLNEEFIGRKFKVLQVWVYGTFIKHNAIKKANVICRNFTLSPVDIRKKLKIADGGDDYLLFCRGSQNELLVIHGERL